MSSSLRFPQTAADMGAKELNRERERGKEREREEKRSQEKKRSLSKYFYYYPLVQSTVNSSCLVVSLIN